MEQMSYILAFVVLIILLWFTYINLSYFITKHTYKKQDLHMESCLTSTGRYFYNIVLFAYVISYLMSIYFSVSNLVIGEINTASMYLNFITIVSIGISFLLQCIIHTGRKFMLIGRIPFEYRNIKRSSFPTSRKLEFTCNQKVYHSTLLFIDKQKVKKALQRAR